MPIRSSYPPPLHFPHVHTVGSSWFLPLITAIVSNGCCRPRMTKQMSSLVLTLFQVYRKSMSNWTLLHMQMHVKNNPNHNLSVVYHQPTCSIKWHHLKRGSASATFTIFTIIHNTLTLFYEKNLDLQNS